MAGKPNVPPSSFRRRGGARALIRWLKEIVARPPARSPEPRGEGRSDPAGPPPAAPAPGVPSSSLCPSAQPGMDRAVLFAEAEGPPPSPVRYFDRVVPVPGEMADEAIGRAATERFRIAATCVEERCVHWDGRACRLAHRVIEHLPSVVDALPPCAIRASCRWWLQEGAAACTRCPQIVTDSPETSADRRRVGEPSDP